MEIVPERLLARVISLDFFGSIGLMPLGYVLAAGIAGLASPGLIVSAGAAVGTALFVAALPVAARPRDRLTPRAGGGGVKRGERPKPPAVSTHRGARI